MLTTEKFRELEQLESLLGFEPRGLDADLRHQHLRDTSHDYRWAPLMGFIHWTLEMDDEELESRLVRHGLSSDSLQAQLESEGSPASQETLLELLETSLEAAQVAMGYVEEAPGWLLWAQRHTALLVLRIRAHQELLPEWMTLTELAQTA